MKITTKQKTNLIKLSYECSVTLDAGKIYKVVIDQMQKYLEEIKKDYTNNQ